MQITIPLTIDVVFDLECDGETAQEDVINKEVVARAVADALHGDHDPLMELTEIMLENITDATGWCIQSLSLTAG